MSDNNPNNPYGEFKPRRRFSLIGCMLVLTVLLLLILLVLIALGPVVGTVFKTSFVTVAP
jgi:competence protein ComGC